ncbi:MAG: type IV pilus twitching motility protein PilT [Clostridia bacterium]|nr:type IV pilus twitching motility protein PilT [Clostridia bacterium]
MNINDYLELAASMGASDVHISVGLAPIMRCCGSLKQMDGPIVTTESADKIKSDLLTEGQMKALDLAGELDVALTAGNDRRFRLNLFKERGNWCFAFRYLNTEILSFNELGLPKIVEQLCQLHQGLVLVTGPTGMGKTTSLSSMIDYINQNTDKHIITLEEPIEYLHTHKKSIVNQREIGSDSKSFNTALKAVLRQDPDVILIGEMRDLESIAIALTAAETGHLVLSTLHTIGSAKTIDRIIDVFPPYQQAQIKTQLAAVLNCVISQQLIPSVDPRKRVLAYEVMVCTPAISSLIREGKTHQIQNMIQTNSRNEMITMDKCLYSLYKKKKITKETALLYCLDKDYMEQLLIC